MTKETKYCPNPDECNGKCPTLKEILNQIDNKLDNVFEFIVTFFEDIKNFEHINDDLPREVLLNHIKLYIHKELQVVINKLNK